MSRDLEETLAELGPAYRDVVARLRAAYPDDARSVARRTPLSPVRGRRLASFLVAASVMGGLALAALFLPGPSRAPHPGTLYTVAYGGRGAAAELVRTQNADGGWGSDFLTRQNAAALRGVEEASVAYRRAVRHLRAKGLAPLTDAELRQRAFLAARF